MTAGPRIVHIAGALLAAGSLAVGVLLPGVPGASAGATDDFADVDARVRAAMDASGVPGLAYGIVDDGLVVHVAAFGTAGPDGRRMTPQTPVVIGSVGKSITALAIRQLVEAGRIDEDAPVTEYLPWFSLAGPDGATEGVTVRSLLAHTSGLSTADGQDRRWYEPGLTTEDVVRAVATVRADRPAGSREYSNLNYVVLGAVVEAVSGQPYGDYVREHIFGPLGMEGSQTSLVAAAGAATPAPAQGHRFVFGIPVAFDEPYPTGMVAAGYQVSTAEDMARFVAALANGGRLDGVDVVTPGGPEGEARAYGTDWRPLSAAGTDVIVSQSGSTLSSNADILVWPSRGRGVVVLLNANPTQLFGMPAGAADIALDVMRGSDGTGPGSSAPTVRTVYLVVDALLLVLVAAFGIHTIRARTWRGRLATTGHRGLFLGRTALADFVVPVAVVVGVPLWIGSTGSSPAGDLRAGWAFALWTLPDLAVTALVLAVGALVLGIAKVGSHVRRPALGG